MIDRSDGPSCGPIIQVVVARSAVVVSDPQLQDQRGNRALRPGATALSMGGTRCGHTRPGWVDTMRGYRGGQAAVTVCGRGTPLRTGAPSTAPAAAGQAPGSLPEGTA